MPKSYHYTDEELKFIENNWQTHTDKEIAKLLGRTEESVARQRKKFGWIKPAGRPSREAVHEAIKNNINEGKKEFSLANLDKDERLRIYKDNFDKNHERAELLRQELHEDEFEYYKHKYLSFIDSVDSLHHSEEDALHHMIMADITISRMRRRIKQMEASQAIEDAPLVYGLYEALDKAEKKFVEYQKILNTTRSQRLSKEKEHKETIATVVQGYRNKMAREELGRQAGLMEIYREKCSEDMSKNRYLLGK
jgi:deoxyadenosine/deoxycytidine kinase